MIRLPMKMQGNEGDDEFVTSRQRMLEASMRPGDAARSLADIPQPAEEAIAPAPAPHPQTAVQPRGLPSGEASPDQDADMKRRLALVNAIQVASQGIGNIANIYRPGTSTTSGVEAMFSPARDSILQPADDAAKARKKAMEDQTFAGHQQSQDMQALQLQALRESMDPTSETSVMHRKHSAAYLRILAGRVPEKNRPFFENSANELENSRLSAFHASQLMGNYPEGQAANAYARDALQKEMQETKAATAAQALETKGTQALDLQAQKDAAALERAKLPKHGKGGGAGGAAGMAPVDYDSKQQAAKNDYFAMKEYHKILQELEKEAQDPELTFEKAGLGAGAEAQQFIGEHGPSTGKSRDILEAVGLAPSKTAQTKRTNFFGRLQPEQIIRRIGTEKTVRVAPLIMKQMNAVNIEGGSNRQAALDRLRNNIKSIEESMATERSRLKMDKHQRPVDEERLQQILDQEDAPASAAAPGGAQPASAVKPKVVKQGGHTYTLNEQTGKYE